MDYAFHEASPTSEKCTLRFKVKTAHDAHVCLSSSDEQDATPIIEIFLGGWDNSKCAIRRDRAKPDRVSTVHGLKLILVVFVYPIAPYILVFF